MADLFIGLMSGTSMDGIDAALVDFSANKPHIIATHTEHYPAELNRKIIAAVNLTNPRSANLSLIDTDIGQCFANAAINLLGKSSFNHTEIRAIGSHGQTIRHEPDQPDPYSLQLGNADIIAGKTGIDVVADFRRQDIEAGGQGAPLVPAFHKALFAYAGENRAVLNIGGIANLTLLPADPTLPVTGFDTGPGNTLMDNWTRKHLKTEMDTDGQWAASGTIDEGVLQRLLDDSYFKQLPPKSTGLDYFNIHWLIERTGASDITPANMQATLCALTATTIADAIGQHAAKTQRLLVCGGGIHNKTLMQHIKDRLDGIAIESTQQQGINPDWVEAAAFAWLAKQKLEGSPGNIPQVTGADHPVVLGSLHTTH